MKKARSIIAGTMVALIVLFAGLTIVPATTIMPSNYEMLGPFEELNDASLLKFLLYCLKESKNPDEIINMAIQYHMASRTNGSLVDLNSNTVTITASEEAKAAVEADEPVIIQILTAEEQAELNKPQALEEVQDHLEANPPAEEEEEDDTPTEYTVQLGDYPWQIAEKLLGNGRYYGRLMSYNGLKPTEYIHVGQVLKIPKTWDDEYDSTVLDLPRDKAVAVIRSRPLEDTSNFELLGQAKITGYDPYCTHCCYGYGITSCGELAEFGRTVACNTLPLGTKIYIEGYGYFRVDDRGGSQMSDRLWFDIACPSHEVCADITDAVGRTNVYLVKE